MHREGSLAVLGVATGNGGPRRPGLKSRCHHLAQSNVSCMASQALFLHERTVKILASPVVLVLSPSPPSGSGRPLTPSSYPAKALDTPLFMSTERLLEGAGSCPSGGVQPVVCVPRLSSDQGDGPRAGSLGQRAVGVPPVPAHKAPAAPTRSQGVLFHRVRI